MSYLATEIKARLDALGSLGTLTVQNMPATPDAIGTIYEYGGQQPDMQFGVQGIKYEKPAFQVVFRGAPGDSATPRAKADIAWRNLAAVQPGALAPSAAVYLMIIPQQSPFLLEKDNNERFKWACNFYATKELS